MISMVVNTYLDTEKFGFRCSQLYFIHPFHHHETGPPQRSAPFVPLFRPFPHLPPPPLLCSLSGPQLPFLFTLGCRACSLHKDKPPPPTHPAVLLWYYFSSLPALVSRGLISGDTATAATTRPNMHPGNRPSQLFSSVTQDLNTSPVIGRSPRPLWDCRCPRIQLHPFPGVGDGGLLDRMPQWWGNKWVMITGCDVLLRKKTVDN